MSKPCGYTKEIGKVICERISEGEPLRQICRDEGMPAWRTVYQWLEKFPEFNALFMRARDEGFDAIAESCLDIADDATNDWMERSGKDGGTGYELNGEHVQRSKLRIHTRLQLLAKWNPKKYGEKLAVEGNITGGIAERLTRARARAKGETEPDDGSDLAG